MSLTLISRSANNLLAPRWQAAALDPRQVRTLTVHHSGGPAGQPWREIQWAAMGQKRDDGSYWFSDSHYNFGVDGNGVHELRGLRTRGAHDGTNDGWGICVRGTWHDELPPAAALDNLVAAVAWLEREAGRELTLLGHRDRMATGCPGGKLYEWVKTALRARLRGEKPPAPPKAPVTAVDPLRRHLMSLPTLRRGAKGPHVARVQGLLISHGYNLGAWGPRGNGIDSDFGPATERAVKQFQVARKVPNSVRGGQGDGIVGAQTRIALNSG